MSKQLSLVSITLAVTTLLVTAACSDTTRTPPLAPSSGGSTSGASLARTSKSALTSQQRFSVALTVPAYPACPLTPPAAGELTGSGVLTILIRTTSDANGGTHVGTTITGHGKATDATGGAWTWSDADLNNEVIPGTGNTSSNSFEQTRTENFHVIGPKGQKIMVQGVFHITVVDGTVIVEFEKGNHEANEFCESGFALTPLP
jgi:hypothetical protein